VRWDWTLSVLRPLFGLLYQPGMMDDDECGAVSGMIGRGNRSTRRKLSQCRFARSKWPDPGSNRGQRGGKPASNLLSLGTACSSTRRLVMQEEFKRDLNNQRTVFVKPLCVRYSVQQLMIRLISSSVLFTFGSQSAARIPLRLSQQQCLVTQKKLLLTWAKCWAWVPYGRHYEQCSLLGNRLCDLVVRVSGYRSRGLGSIPVATRFFWEVLGLERGPLSLVSTIEELRGRLTCGYCGGDLHPDWLTG
jgi:hypothetical protein